MMPAQIIVEIAEEGGEIRLDSGRLKVKGVPARLVPLIREHKAALLALLSAPAPDDYATAEREAIQEESAEVSDLPDKPVLSLQEQAEAVLDHYGADWQRGVDDLRIVAKNHVLAALVEKMGIDATQPALVDSGQDMPLPERVTCGQCVRFQQGPQPLAIGRCLATVTGQPPAGNRGDYRAAFPMAPRSCPEFLGSAS
ncbi:MAG: hypothetical protein M0003_14915 [Acidithiobacillus sp.]|nr:hypothetical protein [Acidithiobacillus sp.]